MAQVGGTSTCKVPVVTRAPLVPYVPCKVALWTQKARLVVHNFHYCPSQTLYKLRTPGGLKKVCCPLGISSVGCLRSLQVREFARECSGAHESRCSVSALSLVVTFFSGGSRDARPFMPGRMLSHRFGPCCLTTSHTLE